jgi:hypothetical protein
MGLRFIGALHRLQHNTLSNAIAAAGGIHDDTTIVTIGRNTCFGKEYALVTGCTAGCRFQVLHAIPRAGAFPI